MSSKKQGWTAKTWVYSRIEGVEITVKEPSTADCFEYEVRAGKTGNDSAADWLLSNFIEIDGVPLNPLSESRLDIFDRMDLLLMLRQYDRVLEPLDGKTEIDSEHFKHPESGYVFTFERPPFNLRLSSLIEREGQSGAVVSLAKKYTFLDNIPLSGESIDLAKLPYCIGDIACRHFSQKLARLPEKKLL